MDEAIISRLWRLEAEGMFATAGCETVIMEACSVALGAH